METRTVGWIQTGTMRRPRTIRFDGQDVNIISTEFWRQVLAGRCREIVHVKNYPFARHGARSSITIVSMINVHGEWINGLENASKSPDYFSSLYSFNMNYFYINLTLQSTVKDKFFLRKLLCQHLQNTYERSALYRITNDAHLQGLHYRALCRYKIVDSLLRCAVINLEIIIPRNNVNRLRLKLLSYLRCWWEKIFMESRW